MEITLSQNELHDLAYAVAFLLANLDTEAEWVDHGEDGSQRTPEDIERNLQSLYDQLQELSCTS